MRVMAQKASGWRCAFARRIALGALAGIMGLTRGWSLRMQPGAIATGSVAEGRTMSHAAQIGAIQRRAV